jgi:hypothetical protein
MGSLSSTLYELKLYAEEIQPCIKNWYERCQRPGEFQKRTNAIKPTTIVHLTTLIFFPKTAAIGLIASAVMPEAADRILHNPYLQEIDYIMDKLNLSDTQKKAATVGGIVLSSLLSNIPYFTIPPSLFIAKLIIQTTIDRYYERR